MKPEKIGRGALLVLEGCDKAGKSTQVKRLVSALNNLGIPAEARSFPDRKTQIGSVINEFLANKKNLPAETAHLLFSANRWECSENMRQTLESGTTLIVDRYAASGAAYTASVTNRPLQWCKEPDRGLPAPDFVALLTINEESLCTRPGWADERFERVDIQKKVAANFLKLKEHTWKVIEANQTVDDVHKVILEKALEIIERVKSEPIGSLYNDE